MEFVVRIGRRNSSLLKVLYLRDLSQLELQWHKSDRTISAMSARLADCCPALHTITIDPGPNRKKELWKLEVFQNMKTLMECFPQLSCLSYKPKNFTHRSVMLTVPRMPKPAHMSPHPRHVSPDESHCRENTNLQPARADGYRRRNQEPGGEKCDLGLNEFFPAPNEIHFRGGRGLIALLQPSPEAPSAAARFAS
jgi:hypothetical protein